MTAGLHTLLEKCLNRYMTYSLFSYAYGRFVSVLSYVVGDSLSTMQSISKMVLLHGAMRKMQCF
jgi:hypothetical protein